MAGALTVTESGKIFFLYTRPTFRHRGLASALLAHAGQGFKLNALQISFPNNASLEGFVKKKGFVRNELSQYEMYMPLMSTEI